MPGYLNNVQTQNNYADAVTAVFTPRKSFSVHVFNAGVFYQLAINLPGYNPGQYEWESAEHVLAPSLNTFRDPVDEGFPEGSRFAGIRFRSSVNGTPATITVLA